MLRLLIVDDEPITTEGLYEMLSEVPDLELDLYKATSADEAISRLSRTKMDIVLSDIRMPEMDGLQLQQWIQARWPRCKVIFLTGIRDIQYAQQVLRSGGVDYVLKTEGDEAIVRSIRQATNTIFEEMRNEEVLIRAKGQLKEVLPMLRREWFFSLLEQGELATVSHNSRLQELDTRLNQDMQVILVCGRVDRWKEGYSTSDKTLLLYAVQNIAEEYMQGAIMLPIMLGGSYFVWLIQSKAPEEMPWEEMESYVQGTLESIQYKCKELLSVPVSFICHERPLAWNEIPKTYKLLKQNLILGLGSGEEMILLFREQDRVTSVSDVPGLLLTRIENTFEVGQEQMFQDLLSELFQRVPNHFTVYAQAYYAVAVILLNQWNKMHRSGLTPDVNADPMIGRLLDVNSHLTKEQAHQFLSQMGQDIFREGKQEQDERTHRIIQKLNKYIVDHLNKDLSLAILADAVYLNPSYLSNLYKTFTGRNISDYITELRVERAKTLLAESHAKVQEIACAVGFDTAGYFTRFFKRHVGVTPQEFRSRLTTD
ncbi:response regulator transcription factor [Paenibacillus sp. LPE1-1-1.1]|uniref:response regulator transcription factor n=1 Tax=Paenibacillus sp. LPE1-1-1.1 TaxID=3135230 RepID=UPI00342ACF74